MSGFRAYAASSKRTWSLPFPVAPWAMASAPVASAARTRPLAMMGRASEVPSR
ncbi:hypothetical protein BH24ACT7_BH24ACT7_01090 [soil metagenome]